MLEKIFSFFLLQNKLHFGTEEMHVTVRNDWQREFRTNMGPLKQGNIKMPMCFSFWYWHYESWIDIFNFFKNIRDKNIVDEKRSLRHGQRTTHSCRTNAKPITDGSYSKLRAVIFGQLHTFWLLRGIGWVMVTHTCAWCECVCVCVCASVLSCLSEVVSSKQHGCSQRGASRQLLVFCCSDFSLEYSRTTRVTKRGE